VMAGLDERVHPACESPVTGLVVVLYGPLAPGASDILVGASQQAMSPAYGAISYANSTIGMAYGRLMIFNLADSARGQGVLSGAKPRRGAKNWAPVPL
jgi:hypothetical protein